MNIRPSEEHEIKRNTNKNESGMGALAMFLGTKRAF
jgi:hypothetical protein